MLCAYFLVVVAISKHIKKASPMTAFNTPKPSFPFDMSQIFQATFFRIEAFNKLDEVLSSE